MAGRAVVDWGIVISGAITGIVGIAGIGGSIMSARLAGKSATQNLQVSITAENERARLAEKRRCYMHYLAASSDLINSMAKQHVLGDDADDALSTALVYERGEVLTGVLSALGELLLVAPEPVMHLADSAATLLAGADPDAGKFRELREQLLWAMRADLGELI